MSAEIDAESILAARYKSTEVDKEVKLQFDIGNLLASDLNNIDTAALKSNSEEYLKSLMRDNAQLLVNEIWKLPTEHYEGAIVAKLPPPSTVLPREKPIPKPRELTKWERFAKAKGILKKKKSRMVFDEKTQEWKPRWGYKRVNDPKDDWMVEIPQNADPYKDPFEERDKERKERIAKNEYQRLRNIARTEKSGRLKVPLPPPGTRRVSKHESVRALGVATSATASVGKFTEKLPMEPTPRNSTKRKKFDPVVCDSVSERTRNLGILEKIARAKEVLDTTKAVNRLTSEKEKRVHEARVAEQDGEGKIKRRKLAGRKEGKQIPRKKAGGGKKQGNKRKKSFVKGKKSGGKIRGTSKRR